LVFDLKTRVIVGKVFFEGTAKLPWGDPPRQPADKVARASVFGLTKLKTLNPLQRIVEINGEPGIVSYVEGRPQSVFTIEVNDGRIRAIFIVTNPEKLSHLPPPPF